MEATTLHGKDIFLIAEQRGIIHTLNPEDGTLEPYIDIRDDIVSSPDLFDERGLLGFALHPNFKTNKKLYTYTIRGIGGKDYVVISEITEQDLKQEKLLMLIEQPGTRRNGGQVIYMIKMNKQFSFDLCSKKQCDRTSERYVFELYCGGLIK